MSDKLISIVVVYLNWSSNFVFVQAYCLYLYRQSLNTDFPDLADQVSDRVACDMNEVEN